MPPNKTLRKVLSGRSDANIVFTDLTALLVALGFQQRVRGSHHIFSRSGVADILNLQPTGNRAKPYQVRQVRAVILSYELGEESDEQI